LVTPRLAHALRQMAERHRRVDGVIDIRRHPSRQTRRLSRRRGVRKLGANWPPSSPLRRRLYDAKCDEVLEKVMRR
jgi:hypothetical protein